MPGCTHPFSKITLRPTSSLLLWGSSSQLPKRPSPKISSLGSPQINWNPPLSHCVLSFQSTIRRKSFPWVKVNEAARLQQKRFCKNSQFRDGSKLYIKPDLQFRALQHYKRVGLPPPLLSQDCRFSSDSCSVLEGGDSSWLQVEGPGLSLQWARPGWNCLFLFLHNRQRFSNSANIVEDFRASPASLSCVRNPCQRNTISRSCSNILYSLFWTWTLREAWVPLHLYNTVLKIKFGNQPHSLPATRPRETAYIHFPLRVSRIPPTWSAWYPAHMIIKILSHCWFANWPPYTESKERTGEGADRQSVGGRLSKQENLSMKIVTGSTRWVDLHPHGPES